MPTPVSNPRLIAWSPEVAQLIGWGNPNDKVQALAGNTFMDGQIPFATRYGGHQFGHWAGQLGDGRALIIAESNGYEIQLKGAGRTPYSRRGDGRAVRRSSLREYLCSEAMHFLGIPTTRALALVETGDTVVRDLFYDGHPEEEPGAICTRVAPSFLRFGHFEILAADQDFEGMKEMLAYVLGFYPGKNTEEFFIELCERTARLMVDWTRVGFVHGVMNTDNMSLLGLTIDYGPYGWQDVYDPSWTPNTTDREHKRYRFGAQPSIARWNLERLATALALLGLDPTSGLQAYESTFTSDWKSMMSKKLGLKTYDHDLVRELDSLLQETETDMTLFYRELAEILTSGFLGDVFYEELPEELRTRWESWLKKWRHSLRDSSKEELKWEMNQVNPAFILRNYLTQDADDALSRGDRSLLEELELALRDPYKARLPHLCVKRPERARHRPGSSMLSCSS